MGGGDGGGGWGCCSDSRASPGGGPCWSSSSSSRLPFWNFLLGALSRLFTLCLLFLFLTASLSKSHPGCLSQSLYG